MKTTLLNPLASLFLLLICFASPVGCSRKKAEPVAKQETTSADLESTPQTEPLKKEELVLDLVDLMKKAEAENADGKFEESFATWQAIHKKVANKFGVDGWQTVSAELALSTARQRTEMSAADRELNKTLSQLMASATSALQKKNFNEARIDIEKAAGVSTRLWGKESYVSANVNFVRAQCYLGLGLHERAIAVLNDVLNLRIGLTGLNHPDVETTLDLLAKSNVTLKKHTAAVEALEKLVLVTEKLRGTDEEIYANRCNELAVSYNNSRQPNQAIPWFDKALEIRTQLHGKDSVLVGQVCLNRGMSRVQLKDFAKAKTDLARALEIFRVSNLDPKDSKWPILYDQLGTVALILKENTEGQKYYSDLADYWKSQAGESDLEYGKALYKLSVSIGNQKRYQDAEPIMKKAISIFEEKLGYGNRLLHQPLTTYSRLLEKMGVPQEAQKIKDRAVRLAGFQELPD